MLGDLLLILALAMWAGLVGRTLLSLLEVTPANRIDSFGLSVPLGLGALAMAALMLGEVGWLDRTGFTLVLFAGLLGCVIAWFVRAPGPLELVDFSEAERHGWTDSLFKLALAATLIGTFLTSLMPVTDGDALCYHLQVPKQFLLRHAMFFDPDLHETVYPLVTEMLYAVALAFRGPIACRLVHWLLGLTFAANVTALARPSLGGRAWWAGTIALLVPAVSNGMSAALNDVSLAAFGTAALVVVMMGRDETSTKRMIAAGLFAGLAIGVKYPALVWVGVLAAVVLTSGRNIRVLRSAIVFGAVTVLVGGSWYLRAYMHTGNPVYPFFRHVFGGSGIDDVLDPIKRPLSVTWWNILTALGPMTLDPDRFDSMSHQFGPAFLLFVPGLVLLRPPKRVVWLSLVGFAFLSLCLTQRQSMRFLLLIVGPFSVAVAWIIREWLMRESRAGRVLVGVMLLIAVFESTIAIGRIRHGLFVVSGRESTEAFLHRREPTYRVGRWIDANLPLDARIIGQDHRGFYLPRDYAMELSHRRRTGLGTHGETPEAIVAQLQREGFTHLLTCPPDPITAVEFDGLLTQKIVPWLASRAPLYEESITDPDGVTRRYRIDELSTNLAMKPRSR